MNHYTVLITIDTINGVIMMAYHQIALIARALYSGGDHRVQQRCRVITSDPRQKITSDGCQEKSTSAGEEDRGVVLDVCIGPDQHNLWPAGKVSLCHTVWSKWANQHWSVYSIKSCSLCITRALCRLMPMNGVYVVIMKAIA